MPSKRNRVTPMGDLVGIPLRGAWTGNRGILHRSTPAGGMEVARFHAGSLWIICELEHKDWRLPQWQPGHFTVLFFHDEAVALSAGHRPCALCRRDAYDAYRQAWAAGRDGGLPSAKQLDAQLHAERIVRGTHRRRLTDQAWPQVPEGAFVSLAGQPALVRATTVVPWTYDGYALAQRRPGDGAVSLITPPSTLTALRNGYQPQIDSSANQELA